MSQTTETESIVQSIVAEIVSNQPDVERAVSAILRRLKRNGEEQNLWNEETAREVVATMVYQQRHRNISTAVAASWMNPVSAAKMEKAVVTSMLNDYTVGNKRLGDCIRADLSSHLAWCHTQRKGWAVKAAFIDALTMKLPDEVATVRSVMNDADCVNLHRSAEGGVL